MDPAGIALRPATLTDVPDLAGVQLQSALAGFAHIFPESVPKPTQAGLEGEWRLLVSDPNRSVIVATAGDVLVGVVVHGPDAADLDADCVLLKLYVVPSWSGKGIGSALHDHAVAELRAAGFRRARLWVLEGNLVARRMYERRGWRLEPWTRTDWPDAGIIEVGYTLELGYSSAM